MRFMVRINNQSAHSDNIDSQNMVVKTNRVRLRIKGVRVTDLSFPLEYDASKSIKSDKLTNYGLNSIV